MFNIAKQIKDQTDSILRRRQVAPGSSVTVKGGTTQPGTGPGTPPEMTDPGRDLERHKVSGDHDGRYYTEVEVLALLNFLGLSDTPATYTGQAGKVPTVNEDEDGLAFTSAPPSANGLPQGGTTGQVLEKIDGTDYNAQWVTPSGGGGLPPERLYVPLGVDEGYDDEFNDGAINGAWVPVDVSGKSNTWYEVSGIKGISVLVPALQGDQKLTGLLRPLSGMSAPFYIETALRIFSRNQNYPMGGVIFADGVTVGAGNQIALRYSIIENKVEYGVHTGFDAQITNTNYSLNVGQKADWIYLRIAWTGANAFSLYASVDGVVWLKMNDVTPTITPTHFGLVMGSWANPPYPYTGNFGYFRVRSGTPDNG